MVDPVMRDVLNRPAPSGPQSGTAQGTAGTEEGGPVTVAAPVAVAAGSIEQLGVPADWPVSGKLPDGAGQEAVAGPPGAPALAPPRLALGAAEIGLLISALIARMDDAQSNSEQQGLKLDDSQRQEAYRRSNEKIAEAVKKLQQAHHKQGALGILSTIGKVLAGVAAVALTLATAGAAAPLAIAIVAYTVVDTGLTIADSISQAAGGPRLDLSDLMQEGFTQAAKACGDDDRKAAQVGQWCAFGVEVAVAVLTIAFGVGSLASAAKGAAGSGSLASKLGDVGFKAVKLTGVGSQAIGSATQAASGGVAIAIGIDQADAEKAQADKVLMDAVAVALGEMIRNTLDRLQLIAADLSSGMKAAGDIVSKVGETNIAVAGASAMV